MDNKTSDKLLTYAKDISSLYGALIAFETDTDRICKMIRRRIDLIEPILPQLNPQHFPFILLQVTFALFLSFFLLLTHISQNTYRLGELYSELADIKMKIMENQPNPTPHQIKKANEL